MGRRADPAGRGQRPGCVEPRRASLAGPGLPAPRRVRVVAAGPGAAGRRAAGPVAVSELRAAAAAADGHAPLVDQIRLLAERARIPLQAPPAGLSETPPPAAAPVPYGLTGRELAVLRLLAAGRTNPEIGAELYISPKTASVHVSSILRKLGVSGRAQAAALAERAGLLPDSGKIPNGLG